MKTKTLFRLKSNRSTIVEPIGEGRYRVFWSARMEFGADSSWMISRQAPANLIRLTSKESETVRRLRSDFETSRSSN